MPFHNTFHNISPFTIHFTTYHLSLNNFYQPMTTFTTYQRGIHYMGIMMFNSLPQSIEEVSSNARKFEICLKQFLHTHSFYSIENIFNINLALTNNAPQIVL